MREIIFYFLIFFSFLFIWDLLSYFMWAAFVTERILLLNAIAPPWSKNYVNVYATLRKLHYLYLQKSASAVLD